MFKKVFTGLAVILLAVFVTTAVQAQQNLDKIKKSGVLKVGMSGSQPPFSMESTDGSLMGFEVDLAELLAESMELELEIVQLPFPELIPALEKGKVDLVMSGMTITMERNMKVAFVGPYVLSGKTILTKSANVAKAEEAEELNQANLKISMLKGSTSEKFVTTLLPEANSMPKDNYEGAVNALLTDEANVMLADLPICLLTMLRYPDKGLVTLSEPLTIEPIGMAVAPGDPLLINFMENYFNALMMAGILSELEEYWFQNGSWLPRMK